MSHRSGTATLAYELPELITVPEAQEEFGLSRATLYRLLRDGKLRRYQRAAGRRKTYVDRAEVKRLVQIRVVKR
jgi:excisionase family DNA binding protein